MYEYIYGVYESVIQNSDSVIILLLIVITLGVVIAIIPLYNSVLKGRKVDKQHEREREQQIIEVIKENSSVIAGLRATLDSNGTATVKAIDRIHTRIDGQAETSVQILTEIAQINTKFDNSLRNQTEMASKINKIFVTTSGGNLPQEGSNRNE